MGGAWLYDDPSRLQGGLCSKDPKLWDRLAYGGPPKWSNKPNANTQQSWDIAKDVCYDCPLMLACAEKGKDEMHGVWGGYDQYERYLAYRRRQRAAQKQAAAEQAAELDEVIEQPVAEPIELRPQERVFPAAKPASKDAWVWHCGRPRGAYYEAETEDGEFLLMKVKAMRGAGSIKWFPRDEVDMRVKVTPVIREWIGRPKEKGGKDAQGQDGVSAGEALAG